MRILYMGSELRNLLGSAGALSGRGHDVFYINLSENSLTHTLNIEEVNVELHEGIPLQTKRINIPFIERKNIVERKIKPTNIAGSVLAFLEELLFDVIISKGDHWPIAHVISTKLQIPLILYLMDIRGLKFLSFVRFAHKYAEILHAPLSIVYNVVLSYLSDFTVLTSKRIEGILRSAGVQRTAVSRPPYVRFQFSPQSRKIESLRPEVLTIATLSRRGNVEVDLAIVKIVLAIARRMPDLLFVVVGTSLEDLKKFREDFTACENVKFIGKILNDDLLSLLYRKTTCVLCPIIVPGFSNRLNEAFFYGKPIITTKIIADYYDGLISGKHCIVEDEFNKWPAIIHSLFDDRYLREELEVGAQSYHDKFFSPQKHALLLERIISSL